MKSYLQINIASYKQILKWSERKLPNGELVGKITNSLRFQEKNIYK